MARQATPLVIDDLSSFARSLGRALAERQSAEPAPAATPGHVELQNLLARAAGFRNLQALKQAAKTIPAAPAVPPARSTPPLTEHARRALTQFDAEGRLLRWPTKFTVQRLAMWVLWTHFDAKRSYTEREVNTILKANHLFGDHATLRRELVNHRLLARESDCSEYRKLPARADDEVRALLAAWRERTRQGAAPSRPAATGLGSGS